MNIPSLPQPKPVRPKIVKVSVLVPSAMHRDVKKLANNEHRSLSAQFLALAEKGLDASRSSGAQN